jgi:hypothetical protein
MTQLFANNAQSTLASAASSATTALSLAAGQGVLFPSPSGGDFFTLTLTQAVEETSWEVVKVTARSTDTLTVVRAQEGTAAADWPAGSKAQLRLTATVRWPLGNIDLTGYPGQTSITTLGTIVDGTWNGQTVVVEHGGTGIAGFTGAYELLISSSANTMTSLPLGPEGSVLGSSAGTLAWTEAGTVTSVDIGNPADGGIEFFGGPVTTNGTISAELVGDLLAVESLNGVGLTARIDEDNWDTRSVEGVAGRTLVTNGDAIDGNVVVDIDPDYEGQTSITTVGTVANGAWHGDPVDAQWGGTNQSGYIPGDMLYALSTVVLDRIAIGPNGKVLTVVANLPSWQDPQAGALESTLVAYGSGGNVVTGNASLTYNDATRTLQLGVGTGPSRLRTADAVSGAGASSLTISTGNASSGVVGAGLLTVAGGVGAGSSAAGSVVVTGGDPPSSGAAGSVAVCGGNSSSGANGSVTLEVGGITRVSVANGNVAMTGNLSVSAALAVTGNVTVSAALSGNSGTFTSTLQSTSLRVTGSTAPADGIYLQAPGVVGLSANNTTAYKYGSNAFLSQADNSRDLGEASTGRWRNLYIVNSPTVGSDLRGKVDVRDCDLGLEFVLALRPIAYRLAEGKVDVRAELVGRETNSHGIEVDVYRAVETSMPGERTHRGFGAQQVRETLDRFGLDGKTFAGWCLADASDPDSRQALRYEQFIAPLVLAIQELEAKVKALGG